MKALTFSDVLIQPKYSDIMSRRDVDLTSDMGEFKLSLPVISANMKSITESEMSIAMHDEGGMGIIHRFNTPEDELNEYKKVCVKFKDYPNVGVSIGVQKEDRNRLLKLFDNGLGARIFCIDVAHGFHVQVKETIEWIRKEIGNQCYIIAGNVATAEGAIFLAQCGADCVKSGVGPGRACMTRKNTGIGVPQLYALETISEALDREGYTTKIISDGGITSVGDIAKALKYADAVMIGSFISGTTETPGKVFKDENGQYYKVYSGSASAENKNDNGQPTDFVEGISIKVPFRGHVKYVLKEIREGLKSCFSYVGATNMKEFKQKCDFIEISGGGKTESKM